MCCKLQQMNKIVESETTYNELFCKPNVLNNNPRANFVMRKCSRTSFISFPFINFCKKTAPNKKSLKTTNFSSFKITMTAQNAAHTP